MMAIARVVLIFKWLGRLGVVPIDASLLVEISVIYLGKVN